MRLNVHVGYAYKNRETKSLFAMRTQEWDQQARTTAPADQ